MIEEAKKILEEESQGISILAENLGENFTKIIELILNSKGRVIIIGLGKSGLIGQKIAATLSSTGTPSFFIHASEALHGDIGMIDKEDVTIVISNSGETEELIEIIPFLKRKGIKIICLTNNPNSKLAICSDVFIDMKVKKETGELGLVPTTSSTVTLALGDAIAMCLLKKRNFKLEDYALLHPSGSLGKKLLWKVDDVMHKGNENPIINEKSSMKEAIIEITSKQLGAISIVNDNGNLVGIITDGDLRRSLEKYCGDLFNKKIGDIMTKNPTSILKGKLGTEALHLMEDRPSQISVLPVIDKNKKVIGMIRIHDLIRAGIG